MEVDDVCGGERTTMERLGWEERMWAREEPTTPPPIMMILVGGTDMVWDRGLVMGLGE